MAGVTLTISAPWGRRSRRLAALASLLFFWTGLAAAQPAHASVETFASGFEFVGGIAVDSGGNVYVVDTNANQETAGADQVMKFDPAGNLLTSFAKGGTGVGEVALPEGIDLDSSGNVYVADAANGRIQKYDSVGNHLATFGNGFHGNPGCPDLEFNALSDVAVDSSGQMYAVNRGGGCVQVLDPTGALVAKWDVGATPDSIALDSSGAVLVSTSEHRIRKFSAAGAFLTEWSHQVGGRWADIALGPEDAVFLAFAVVDVAPADSHKRVVEHRSASGELFSSLHLGESVVGQAHLTGIALDGEGRVYVSQGGIVSRIDPSVPSAALTAGPSPVLTGALVGFDASASQVSLGSVAGYEWDLDGDGSFETDTGSSAQTFTAFGEPGQRVARVRVTAPSGKTDTASASLDVRRAPPPGPIGVSVNNGEQFTNDPNVEIGLTWPSYATDLWVSNDGGFKPLEEHPVVPTIPWTLQSSGPERLPKTVYVRFVGGESGPETYTDDIILDQTPPVVDSATADSSRSQSSARASDMRTAGQRVARALSIKVSASDATSGVADVQLTESTAQPPPWVAFEPDLAYQGEPNALFVRVRDRAGNPSAWKQVSGVDQAVDGSAKAKKTQKQKRKKIVVKVKVKAKEDLRAKAKGKVKVKKKSYKLKPQTKSVGEGTKKTLKLKPKKSKDAKKIAKALKKGKKAKAKLKVKLTDEVGNKKIKKLKVKLKR
jgi:sugar lactone lactonase YvrE